MVPKFWSGPHAYLPQNNDRRVIFVSPYEDNLALLGTTDIAYDGCAEDVSIDESEIGYLLGIVSRYFRTTPRGSDILHALSGVRPLYDDNAENPSAVTRDYVFEIDGTPDVPPLLSIFGGKITTYRKLAEHALGRLAPWLSQDTRRLDGRRATSGRGHPGRFRRFCDGSRARLSRSSQSARSSLRAAVRETRAGASGFGPHLRRYFGGVFYEREASFLRETEWATSAADFLDRRTKRGLHLTPAQRAAFEAGIGK